MTDSLASKLVAKWLVDNDKQLWVDRVRLKMAHAECMRAIGLSCTIDLFRSLRDEHCEFWSKQRFARKSKARGLTERQWLRLGEAIRSNMKYLRGESIEFAVRFLRTLGVSVNEPLLNGSQTYRDCVAQAVDTKSTE